MSNVFFTLREQLRSINALPLSTYLPNKKHYTKRGMNNIVAQLYLLSEQYDFSFVTEKNIIVYPMRNGLISLELNAKPLCSSQKSSRLALTPILDYIKKTTGINELVPEELHDNFLEGQYHYQEMLDKLDNIGQKIILFEKFSNVGLKSIQILRNHLKELAHEANRLTKNMTENPVANLLRKIKGQAEDCLRKNYQRLTALDLNALIQNAKEDYIKINQLNTKRGWSFTGFFNFHGQTGKNRAIKLANDIDNLYKEQKNPYEIFQKIYNHLANGDGPWSDTSFKTIIMKQLSTISPATPDEWLAYFRQSETRIIKQKHL